MIALSVYFRANLADTCVSIHKMAYLPGDGKIIYGNPAGETKVFDVLDFLALLSCHVTDRWERKVIPYGFWSNKSRGMRKKHEASKEVKIIQPNLSSKAYRKLWATWIERIWGSDPLLCTKCGDSMTIIAFIDEFAVVNEILESMDLWEIPQRPPPKPRPQDLYEYDEYEYAIESYSQSLNRLVLLYAERS